MKLCKYKLIIFLIFFLTLNSAEQIANNWYNLESHFEPVPKISIKNDTDDIIDIFGTVIFIDNIGDRKLMNEGIRLESHKSITIDLCDIINISRNNKSKKLTYFQIFKMNTWECSNRIKLDIGAKYIVTREYCNGSMHLVIKKSSNE